MHLRAQKAAEREHQPAAERGQWLEPQRAQIAVGEQTRQEHMQRAQPDHRRWRGQQVQQRELRQVGQSELAVGEDGITGEDVRQPEREHPRVQLLTDPLGQRIVEEPRVQLVKGGSAEQPIAVQHESARGDRQHRSEVGQKVARCALRVARSFAYRPFECGGHAARAIASTDRPNGNGTRRGISADSTATAPSKAAFSRGGGCQRSGSASDDAAPGKLNA